MDITETYRVKNKEQEYETVARINYTYGNLSDADKQIFNDVLRKHGTMLQVNTLRDSNTKRVVAVWVFSWTFLGGWSMAVHYKRVKGGWETKIRYN